MHLFRSDGAVIEVEPRDGVLAWNHHSSYAARASRWTTVDDP
ncbi:Hypothetical protein A7982_11940 [Minicystis rosea]|nr:Hypothetical protein A7982_11940 [Minicystis rosea]